ncbi:alpha-galactosidase [Fictibacillus sp. FJAT-27399]|uniref:alpha-galactosidase n=1 Tax=Fictibacillus sp. FJAT-27399 TaxID=1729689 RepID=UPI0007819CB6|nr:alpha-galactosidase [Fictibacillus sp. FJAT-27399]
MGFSVTCDGQQYHLEDLKFVEEKERHEKTFILRCFTYESQNFRVEYFKKLYTGSGVQELWNTVKNISKEILRIDRIDSINEWIPTASELTCFKSGWGNEYQPFKTIINEEVILENRLGRSSASVHPFVFLNTESSVRMVTVAWSGNWVLRFQPSMKGVHLSGGLSDWEFYKELFPEEDMESVRILTIESDCHDMNEMAVRFNRWAREFWIPANKELDNPLVEWNHWWTYEDSEINEIIFKENAAIAQSLGIDVCTLDAGWFGPPDGHSEWFDWRGDWDKVNTYRFSSGIRALSDEVHERNMKFGFWCEIEGLGKKAEIGSRREDFIAKRNGEHLGYICFGNVEAQDWAISVLDRLIIDYQCDWLKLDFNLDPHAGCSRTDHGHGAGDGLFEHYLGYYRVLDMIRKKHPHVILENCSSGGLRTDLGIMKHNHVNFLSDPDYLLHQLQVFWASSLLLPPSACLHFAWSQSKPNVNGDYAFPPLRLNECTEKEIAFHMRTAMIHRFGLSHPLPEWKERVRQEVKKNIKFYKEKVFPFVQNGDLYRLNEQCNRDENDNKISYGGFQYVLSDEDSSLVFYFSIYEQQEEIKLKCKGLNSMSDYIVTDMDSGHSIIRSGEQLLQEGMTVSKHGKSESSVFIIEAIKNI